MPDKRQLEFFVLRYVPDAVKEEFVNIGVVMFEAGANGSGFSDARFTKDWRHVWCLDPQADIEVLEALERELRSQIGKVHDRELLMRRLQDSFSNAIQFTTLRGCQAENPATELDYLAKLYLEAAKSTRPHMLSGREQIVRRMQSEFERAGVWNLLMHGIPVSSYTGPGDHFKFDFGYRIGDSIKLFHAVSLKKSVDAAVMLASRYPAISSRMQELAKAAPFLTAVVDDGLEPKNDEIRFALEMLQNAKIKTAPIAEMPQIADTAARELGV
jgi:hypothetical protein